MHVEAPVPVEVERREDRRLQLLRVSRPFLLRSKTGSIPSSSRADRRRAPCAPRGPRDGGSSSSSATVLPVVSAKRRAPRGPRGRPRPRRRPRSRPGRAPPREKAAPVAIRAPEHGPRGRGCGDRGLVVVVDGPEGLSIDGEQPLDLAAHQPARPGVAHVLEPAPVGLEHPVEGELLVPEDVGTCEPGIRPRMTGSFVFATSSTGSLGAGEEDARAQEGRVVPGAVHQHLRARRPAAATCS